LRILLAEVDVDRFGIAGLDERVQSHGQSLIPLGPSEVLPSALSCFADSSDAAVAGEERQ
jgi:hypothetical protein